MIRLFVNGMGASAGGGLTYLRNILPYLSQNSDIKATLALNSGMSEKLPFFPSINYCESANSRNPLTRFAKEQLHLPRLIQASRSDVLLSIGNFAVRNSPIPQLLLSRNALYTSADFYRDLRRRRELRLLLDSRVKAMFARRSLTMADLTIAPSQAFADELRHWAGMPVIAVHHGFDSGEFFRNQSPLPPQVIETLAVHSGAIRLLHVSHYNYYRNFETLFRALARLKSQMRNRPIKLFLTCKLSPGANPGAYKTDYAARLIRDLGISEDVIQLGHVPYSQLHHLYRACNIYVSAAYAESFAHPLVEAMACGLPMVVSDILVHREISGNSAVFFDRFASEELADAIGRVANSLPLATELSEKGLRRVRDFSWKRHVEKLLEMARQLASVSGRFAHAA